MRAALLIPLLFSSCTWFIIDRLRDNDPESLCGNGIAQPKLGEECDGQDLQEQTCLSLDPTFVSGQLSCTSECAFDVSECQSPLSCGDGIIDAGESCDDQNFSANDGCSSLCQLEPGFLCTDTQPTTCESICGDGLVVGGEACDDQNDNELDGCSSSCDAALGFECAGDPVVCFLPRCGDDFLDAGEECDDNNFRSGDGCSPSCTVEPGFTCNEALGVCFLPNCGDSLLDEGEQCDDGCGADGICDAADNNDGCESSCRFICGGDSGADKAFLSQGSCYLGFDDALTFDETSNVCEDLIAHPVVVTSTEEDLLLSSLVNQFASQSLSIWLGIIEGNDPGNVNGFVWVTPDPLSSFDLFSTVPTSTNVADCGVRVEGVGWNIVPCDEAHRAVCEIEARCGDGVVAPAFDEFCDDGNNLDGDGCRADCGGFERCGDSVLDDDSDLTHPEECDDGNVISGDGCNRVCQAE